MGSADAVWALYLPCLHGGAEGLIPKLLKSPSWLNQHTETEEHTAESLGQDETSIATAPFILKTASSVRSRDLCKARWHHFRLPLAAWAGRLQLKLLAVPAHGIPVSLSSLQNVLLQMGLHVLAVNGMLIRQARSYILRCHGCFK